VGSGGELVSGDVGSTACSLSECLSDQLQ